jgi:geranylgeranyl pyrophosphate synthase
MLAYDIKNYIKRCQRLVNATLKKKCPPVSKQPCQLHQAMRYAVLNGGKRLRAAFAYATGEAMGASQEVMNDVCAAIEMIHAFSLIHDDLPALDNDDLRRGKATCHKVYGEATAILAGDALQSLAFEILSALPADALSAETKLDMINFVAKAIGSQGMIGGEELDIRMVKQSVSIKQLERMYLLKTGCLLKTSVVLGALAANCKDNELISHLSQFSDCIGLAFQIHDDIIGISSSTEVLGKKQGADIERDKPVYPLQAGMEGAKKRAQFLYQQSLKHLDKCNMETAKLKALSAYVIERHY